MRKILLQVGYNIFELSLYGASKMIAELEDKNFETIKTEIKRRLRPGEVMSYYKGKYVITEA